MQQTIKVHAFDVGPFQMNAYIIYKKDQKECILVDPGDDPEVLINFIEENSLKPVAIFNTHAHIDHIRFAGDIQKKYNLPFYLAEEEIPLLNTASQQAAMFGLDLGQIPQVTNNLKDAQSYDIAGMSFKTALAPGHSPGSICLIFDDFAIVGDVLFYDSIGRTDLYMGNYQQLIDSIKNKLWPLPDETVVYPGHGPETTIGREKQFNPFLQEL